MFDGADQNRWEKFDKASCLSGISAVDAFTMSHKWWNNDVTYAFSIHKVGMLMLGTWPMRRGFLYKIPWIIIVSSQSIVLVGLITELFLNGTSGGAVMEGILLLEFTVLIIMKHVSLALYGKRLEKNLNSASDDWWSSLTDHQAREKMKLYARTTRTLTLIMLCCGALSVLLYGFGSLITNRAQSKLFQEAVSKNRTASMVRQFILPAPWLNDNREWSRTKFGLVMMSQVIQAGHFVFEQCLTDSFFFNLVMHLAGQLDILTMKFREFGQTEATVAEYRAQLRPLIRRHRFLKGLADNLQASFGTVIFTQVTCSAVLVAISEYNVMINLRRQDQVELLKGVLVIIFVLLQCFLYIYAGDFLTAQSEKIFHAVYEIRWYKLPAEVIRDLGFVMMSTRVPIRLSGGKFFYVSRSTMMSIIRTAASYLSVLQVAIKD